MFDVKLTINAHDVQVVEAGNKSPANGKLAPSVLLYTRTGKHALHRLGEPYSNAYGRASGVPNVFSLFVPQRDGWVESHRPLRRNKTCNQRHRGQQCRHKHECLGIHRADSEK
jgi:hypothetical protein